MAVAVTGAALRMACALGIHRESPPEHMQNVDTQNDREVKRRTWWSLVCLDIWGSTTLGRPAACDYFGPAITYVLCVFYYIHIFKLLICKNSVHPPSYAAPENVRHENTFGVSFESNIETASI